MEKQLPKSYISYSQYICWRSSKDSYRKKYYFGDNYISTPETEFGKEIAKYLETDNIKGVKRFRKPEHYIEVEIEGVKVIGYLDSFCPRWKKFLEYKTSREDVKDGWCKTKVQKHKQLDFYSMLVQEKYGKVHDECELIVLKTKNNVGYKGHVLEAPIRLSGEVKSFKRKIEQWERDFIKKDLLKAIKEIKEDYGRYNKGTL